MPPKLLFVLVMLAAVTPFVLASLLARATRRGAVTAAGIAVLLLLVVVAAHTGPGRAVFGVLSVFWIAAPVLGGLYAVLLLLAWAGHRAARRRRMDRFWVQPPDLAQFGAYCLAQLEAQGWVPQTRFEDHALSVCRMEKQHRRITAVFMVDPRHPHDVQTRLGRRRWRSYGRTVLVTWWPPTPGFAEDAAGLGWAVLDAKQLEAMAEAYDSLVRPIGRRSASPERHSAAVPAQPRMAR